MATQPPIVAGTIVRYSMKADINSRACVNVVDVSIDEEGIGRGAGVIGVSPAIRDAWQNKIIPALGSWYRFHGCHYTDLDSLDGVTGDLGPNTSLPQLGGAGGSQHTPNTSALIHKRGTTGRQKRQGRMYLAPVLETDTDDGGTLSAGAVTRFQNAVNDFKAAVVAAGTPITLSSAWRVVHVTGHTGDPVPGHPNGFPNAWDSSDITSLTVDPLAATQRRRLR